MLHQHALNLQPKYEKAAAPKFAGGGLYDSGCVCKELHGSKNCSLSDTEDMSTFLGLYNHCQLV